MKWISKINRREKKMENQTESSEFMNALNDMLEIIDNIAPLISDNNYLQLCNGLKKLNDNKSKEPSSSMEVVRDQVRPQNQVRNELIDLSVLRDQFRNQLRAQNQVREQLRAEGYELC